MDVAYPDDVEMQAADRLRVLAEAVKAAEDSLTRLLPLARRVLERTYSTIRRDLLDEAIQDTFVRTLQHIRKGGPSITSPLAFMVRVAHNFLNDRLRLEHNRREVSLPLPEELPDLLRRGAGGSDNSPSPVDASDTSGFAGKRDSQQTILTALHRLGEVERAILTLRYLSGWKLREIATALSLPVSTVGAKSFAALKRLRAVLVDTADA